MRLVNRTQSTVSDTKTVFLNLHGLGHPSHRATKPLINSRFVWHGMNIDIAKWCYSCTLAIVDIRAETVADAFFSGWIARFGTPATITTDRGAQFESKLWDGLCNQFGIVRNRTTSYHPQLNGMVERFHRQLIAAIMAHESPNPWTITLPSILLGVRSAVKELLGRSAADVIYGTTLRLPGEFTQMYTVDAHTNLDNYSDKLRIAMSRLHLFPPRDTHQENIFQYK